MATLKFNLDEGRSTSTAIQTCVTQVGNELNSLKNRVSSMIGSEWQSNSANQFQTEFQSWEQQLQTLLTDLGDLRTRLDQEIVEWEEVASRLN